MFKIDFMSTMDKRCGVPTLKNTPPPPLPRKFEVMKRILDDAIFYDSINEVDVSISIFYNLIAKIEAHILDID